MRRTLHRAGGWLHGLAFAACLFGLVILMFGALRFEVAGIEFEATQWQRPVLWGIGLALLGRPLAWTAPFRSTVGPRSVRSTWRAVRHRRRELGMRVALVALALLVGVHSYQRFRSWVWVRQAKAAGAAGHASEAADAFHAARYRFAANNAYLRDNEADFLYQAGRFDEVIACVGPAFERGASMHPDAYRALWRSYDARGDYAAALRVVRVAMRSALKSSEAQMAECTRLVARYESLATGAGERGLDVRLVVRAPDGEPWTVGGNWSKLGDVSSLHGWSPTDMAFDATAQAWVCDVTLARAQELPFLAVARSASGVPHVAAFRTTESERTVVELAPFTEPIVAPDPVPRSPASDGRARTLVLWPDCGSWQFLHLYAELGFLPNIARMMEQGTSLEMIAARPAFTATSYVQMTELEPEARRRRDDSAVGMLLLQLNGLPVLDALIPDGLATEGDAGSRNLFDVLNANGLSVANMVFSDSTIQAANEHEGSGADELPSKDAPPWRDAADRDQVLATLLGIDRATETARWGRCAEESFAVACIRNTDEKAAAGLAVWNEQRPDFQLLRFPAVDIASHRFIGEFDDAPVTNALLEIYRHLDQVVGRFASACDADDTLVLVSDHGIRGPLTHDEACVFVLEGPYLPADLDFGTIPIGHFPSIILSRFGIQDAALARLTEAERDLFLRHR